MKFKISNDYTSMANILKSDLFNGSLFEKRLLVLPSEQVKSWLVGQWTEDLGIVSGVQFLTLDSAIAYLLSLVKEGETSFVSSLELKILINHFLQRIEHHIDPNLAAYLSVDKEERLTHMSEILANLFQNYAIYGVDLIQNFKNPKKWQEILFHKIFYEKNHSFPLKELPVNVLKKIDIKVYIFGFTYLPELYFDFFYRLSSFSDLFIYYPRITSEFWEDIQSQKAKKYFQKRFQGTQLDQDLSLKMFETNSFFAQFGTLGKLYEKTLGNYDLNFNDYFVERNKKNLLSTFQNNILDLAELDESEPVYVEELSPSICIQEINGSKLEEIKTVYGVIQTLFEKEDINLNDVLVLAPNINQYLSHIKTVFGRQNGFNDFKVHDVEFLFISNLAKGLNDILSLINSDWTYDEIMKVLDNPLVQSNFEIDKKDIEYFKKILQKSRLRFAYDKDHKNSLAGYKNESGTWEESFQKIITAYSTFCHEFEDENYPELFANISQSDLQRIEPFFKVISSLYIDLKDFDQPNLQQLDFYASKLVGFIDKYFKIPDDSIEYAALEVVKSFCLKLKKIDQITTVSFSYFYALLIKELKKKATLNSNFCNAIQFGTLKIDKWPSYKYVFLIGMYDGAFPASISKSSLNLLKDSYYPSKIQIERFTFLTSLINAQDKLWISYPIQGDGSANLPSIFLQDLRGFLNKHYKINGFSFDEWNKKFSYSSTEKSKKKRQASKFLPISYPISGINYKDLEISTYELSLLVKNPIGFYLQKKYSLSLPDLYDSVEEDFFLSPLNKSIFVQDLITDKKLAKKEIKELSPKGIFQEIAENQLYLEKHNFEDKSKSFGLDLEELFSIELSKEVSTKTTEGKKIYLPAVRFFIGKRRVTIVGKIKNIHKKGLVLLKENTTYEWIKNWADIVLFNLVAGQNADFSNSVFFLKSGIRKDISAFDSSLNLKNFVSYFLTSQEAIFPFTKSFILSILKKDLDSFNKNLNQILTKNSKYQDPYEKWFIKHFKLNEDDSFFSIWADYLNYIFDPIANEL